MTSYEHLMLGVTGSLAAGLHRRYGWPIVAMAGIAALVPDWDGLSLVFGAAAFDLGHRTWGHSLWAAALVGAVVAACEYRFGGLERAGRWLLKKFPLHRGQAEPAEEPQPVSRGSLGVWLLVGVLAAWSHLAADLVFSGNRSLPEWGIRLFWPWSSQAWSYPRVPWGDAGVTIVFVAGMFALVRWPRYRQATAILTLLAVAAYVVLRVPLGGSF